MNERRDIDLSWHVTKWYTVQWHGRWAEYHSFAVIRIVDDKIQFADERLAMVNHDMIRRGVPIVLSWLRFLF